MSPLLKSITLILLSSFLTACSVDDPGSNEAVSDGKSYVISGEVTAQVGEGLVLRLSDDNEIMLNNGGSFEFPKSVASGSAFEVTIAKQPTDPLQKCRMTSAFKGIMPRSDLKSIKIVCEFQWTTPENFADHINLGLGIPSKYEVAMNASGDVIIVWREDVGPEIRIYFSEFRDGKWSHPDSIDDAISIVGSDAYSPKVAINDNGLALITWYQIDSSTQRSYLLRSEYLEGSWEHPESLDESFSFPSQINQAENLNPEVALNKAGKGIILWSQNNGNHVHVFMSELANRVWTHPTNVEEHISVNDKNAGAHKVAIGDNGHVVIVWMQSDGTGAEGSTQQIFVSEFRGGNWKHPKNLADNVSFGSTRAFSPTVAMNNNGHTVIAWVQSDADLQNHIYKRQYWIERTTDDTKDKDPEDVGFFWRWYEHETLGEEERVSIPGTNSSNPVVSINSAEEAVLVWESTRGGGGLNLFLVKFSGGQWSGVESPRSSFTFNLTNTARSKSSRLPEVNFSSNGSIIVAWLQVGDGYQSLLRGMFTTAGNWFLPKDIDDSVSIGATLTRSIDEETQEIAVSRIITCENAQEIIRVAEDRTLVSHIIRCSGLSKWINVIDADNVIELVDNGYKVNQTLKCKATESPIDIDSEDIATHILSCEDANETIFIDEKYDFIAQGADDELEPMNTPTRAKVELADNGDGIVVWVQETASTRPKLFISELRTQSKKPKYLIAGSVFGLAGSGLVLKNSVRGADNSFITTETLEISENGNFNFTIKLKETEKYSVSLEQSPTDPVQICDIKNTEGVVATGDISSISVECINDISNATVSEIAAFPGADIVGAAIDSEDNIYIADRGNSQILRYSADGMSTTLVENIVFFQGSTELMVLEDSLYFLYNTALAGGVYKIDLTSLSRLDFSTLSPFASFEKQEKISGITSDPEGNIYISRVDAQTELAFVSKILPTGEVKELEFSAISGGWLTLTGDEEYIYVSELDKISRIDRTGKKHTLMAGLDEPVGLFYKNESIYLIDNEYVRKITPFLSGAEILFDVENLPESESMRLLLDSQNDILLLINNKIWRIE